MIFKNLFQISIILLFPIFIPLTAEGATLYFTPQSQTIFQDDSFIIDIKIDTEGEEINAAEVNLTFPENLLDFIEFSEGNSILNLWPEEPQITEGDIVFLGGVTNGFKGEGQLARIIFLGKETGEVKINFKENSQILLNDGKGTPAGLNFLEGNYRIIEKPENLPKITSKSHPDQNKWYATSTLHLHWDFIEEAEYSYLLSFDPLAEPDEIPDRPEGELIWMGDMSYRGLEKDGIYYFTLKQKLPAEDWLPKTTYRAMIDTIPPEPFELKIGQDPVIFEGKYFLSFNTQDKMSGVDHYEIKENRGEWEIAISPFLLKNQSLGKKIVVRAYDKAGNYQTAEIKPPSETTRQDWLLLILILAALWIIWRTVIRKSK